MLIPLLGFFMGLTLWSQWFPIPGITVPEQSFMRRLSGTFQLTLDSWALCDLVDAVAFQPSRSGDRAVVSFADGPGWANSTDIPGLDLGTDSTVQPDPVESTPPWFQSPLLVSLPVLFWSSDGVTSSDSDEFVDIHPLGSGPGQRIFALLLTLGLWCFLHALFVYAWRLFFAGLEHLIGLITTFLEGEPQIARLQFVYENGSSSFDNEMDLLIAGPTETDEEILAWVMAADSRPDSVSHVLVLSQYRGIWVHRTEEQELDSELACNTTEPANTTDNPCANLVSRHRCNTPPLVVIYASDEDDFQHSADIPTDNGAEINGHEPNPAKRRRRNRPSQVKRHREGKRAHQMNEKELQQEPSEPVVPASSALGASPAVSQSATPLSASTSCANLVSRHRSNTPPLVIYASDEDDFQHSADIPTDNGAEINGHEPNPAKIRRRNRPSQIKRHREGKRAHQMNEKELQQEPSEPVVPASSALGASVAVSQNATPLSASTPAFIPGRAVVQEPQSGPLPPSPLSMEMDIDSPAECCMASHDDNGPRQRSRRRPRHRRHHA